MRPIGIRDLRQQASRYLREVQRGESFEVTDRGRPVAWLVPVPRDPGLAALVASGRLAPAQGDALELGAPIPCAPGVAPASESLARERDDAD